MSSTGLQTQPETLIRHLLEALLLKPAEEFFQALVRAAAQALDVAGVWVTEYLPDRRVLRSLSFWMNGTSFKDFEYKMTALLAKSWSRKARVFTTPNASSNFFPMIPTSWR